MILVLAVLVKNIRNVMELITDIVQVVQNIVFHPNLTNATVLFLVSLINESFSIVPYPVILSGQLLLLEDPFSITMIIKLSLFVVIPIGIGTTLGSLPVYGLAYFGGKPAIEKFSKYLRFSWDSIERISLRFNGSWYDEILFLILRSVPLLPSLPVNAVAGILRMRPAPYLVLTIAGTIIKMLIMFMFVGFGVEGLVQ
ncbi:MAG: hypothetical protein UT07_C0015G0009 [Parcubacteria group bacterium GW2011_GWB1_38_8]|nr:MAG: hypothetical protein UT07_C0015G0009 [Parcubacteria group bacterium GW2011_GWB1_38_8]KKR30406.1 MAG: hypothetical protein UT62_C0014G0006 [Parcubacteria group bacterium GW2011_GWC1_39_8]